MTRNRLSKNPTSGHAQLFEEPLVVHRTLDELVHDTAVIIEGLVDASLPTRARNSEIDSLETDVVVLVTSTIKGQLKTEGGFTRLVVAQNGGTMNGFQQESIAEPRLMPGERVILFLVPDTRRGLPAVAGGLLRFQIAGVWSGKFRIERNTAVVPRASSKGLQIYHKQNADLLRADINASLKNIRIKPLP